LIIKIERSGGLAGITKYSEIDVKDLPSELKPKANKIIMEQKSNSFSARSLPKGAADYYTYKIIFQDRSKKRIIECNQFNIQKDLRSIVKYIERISKEKGHEVT
jgi:hypothetical protein